MDKLDKIIKECVHKALDKSPREENLDEVRNFNDIVFYKNKGSLTESSFNRMMSWMNEKDFAIISAFRGSLKDRKKYSRNKTYMGPDNSWEWGHEFTHEENRQKNKMMVAELMILGYGVTKVKGVYPEGATKESSEESYLVVNINDSEDFKKNILRIAEYYNQDSVYYKGRNERKGHLIGTNGVGWPEYHKKGEGSTLKIDNASNYMSRIGNNAFSFVTPSAKKMDDKSSAMADIEKSKGTDDEYTQRYWKDNEPTSFRKRKELRKQGLMESVRFWRGLVKEQMRVIEDMHPLARKAMSEELQRYKNKRQQ